MLAVQAERLAHRNRLSTIRDADEILVFDDGRVVERGSFAELLAAGGSFASWVRPPPETACNHLQRNVNKMAMQADLLPQRTKKDIMFKYPFGNTI